MGLSGSRNKVKIGKDPRNTTWSNDTSRFGHRHLSKLGWTQGKGLGTGSSGVESITSHVKVTVKVDNTGLGAGTRSIVGDSDISTGLDAFQRILGKLNGNTEQVMSAQIDQRMVVLRGKFGMEFVSGGLLHGTIEEMTVDMEENVQEERENRIDELESDSEGVIEKSKKRKREEKKEKAEKKERKERKRKERKESSKEKSKERRKHKSKDKKKDKSKDKTNSDSRDTPSESEPSTAPSSRASPAPNGRLAARARWIAQKKAATSDAKSLNEILMITA